MSIIISDVSVLIDIEYSQLTNIMFQLPFLFAVPDILFVEELSKYHSHLTHMGLIIKTMSGELIAESYRLHQRYVRTSINDMLALTLAKHEGCQLLTGGKALREAAEELKITVHGTIWLIEQMIKRNKISIEKARIAFWRMRNFGSRLPWNEVEKILNEELSVT